METKNKTNIVPIIILLILLIAGVTFGIIYSVSVLKDNDKNNEKVVDNKKEENKEQVEKDYFIIEEEQSIYLANNKYFEDGSKELISNSMHNLTDGVLKDNKFYYMNTNDELVIYDIKTKTEQVIKFEGTSIHANTLILPGEKYVLVTDCDTMVKIDIKNNSYKNIPVDSNNFYMTYDDKTTTLYYLLDQKLTIYDVTYEKEIGTLNVEGGPFMVDEEYFYIDLFDINGIDMYNKETKEKVRYNITDHWPGMSTINKIKRKDNTFYMLMGGFDKIIEYSNNQESYIYEGTSLDFIYVDNKMYIEDYLIDPYDFNSTGEKKYYEYNFDTKEINSIDNEHVRKIFENNFYFE